MRQPGGSRLRASACLLTGTGTVGAAAVGHSSAGGALPSPMLLAVLVVGLALACAAAPRTLQTARGRLLVAALAQPVLHVLFEQWSTRPGMTNGRLGAGLGVMLLAHGLAALVAVWLLRDAERLLRGGTKLAALLARLTRLLVVPLIRAADAVVPPAPRVLVGRAVESWLRRRGPPLSPAVPFSF